jgi:hypothetical protein
MMQGKKEDEGLTFNGHGINNNKHMMDALTSDYIAVN